MESQKCPKCGSTMHGDRHLQGLNGEIELVPKGGYLGDKIQVRYCENCGFVELFRIKKA